MRTETQTKSITVEALAALGAEQLAYVATDTIDGQTVYVVHAADGQRLGGFATRDVAFAACRQNDLEPVSVH